MLKKFFEKIQATMEKFGDDIDEAMEALNDELDESSFQSSSSGGITIINTNGDVVISGKIKTLTVNGKKVKLES